MWSREPASFFCMWISNSSTVYWKDCSFSIELSWHPCQKSVDCKYEDLVLDSLFCSPKCLSLCWSHSDLFTIDFEIGKYESSNFFKASLIAQLVKNPLAVQETQVRFLGREDLLEKGWATLVFLGLPCGSAAKEMAYNAGDLGSIHGLGRSSGEGKGYPLQYSGLENSMDCVVHGVAKSRTQVNNYHFHFSLSTFSRLF